MLKKKNAIMLIYIELEDSVKVQNILDGSFDFMRWSILGNRELASKKY